MPDIGASKIKTPADGDLLYGQEGADNDASKVRRFPVSWMATAAQLAAESEARVAALADMTARMDDLEAQIAGLGGDLPVGVTPPAITGTGKIGAVHTRSEGAWSIAYDLVETRWTSDGVAIPGATGASHTPQAAQDLTALRVETRVRGASGAFSAWAASAPVAITYPAPTASGSILDQTFPQGGATTLDVASYFSGGGLSYAITTGGAVASLMGSTVSFVDSSPVASASVVVRASNSGGDVSQGFSVTITAASAGDVWDQVEALDGIAGRTSVATLKIPGVDAFPPGVSFGNPSLIIQMSNPGTVLENWDLTGYRLIPNAANQIVRQCVLGEQNAPINNLQYYINVGAGASGLLVENCDIIGFDGVGGAGTCINQQFIGPEANPTVAANVVIRRNTFLHADGDYIKCFGANFRVEQNVFDVVSCYPAGTRTWFTGINVALGEPILNSNGFLFIALAAGTLPEPPSGKTDVPGVWDSRDPHTDIITIKGAVGDGDHLILNNHFKSQVGARSPGLTQMIRYVRDTASPMPSGRLRITGNVFEEWGGFYPFDAGGVREWISTFRASTSTPGYDAGEYAARGDLRFRSLVDANTDDPIGSAKWEQVYDIGYEGPVVFEHNRLGTGVTDVYFANGAMADALSIWDGNVDVVTGDPVPGPDYSAIRATPVPAFGTAGPAFTLTKHGPFTAFDITPTGYGQIKLPGGSVTNACVISVHGQVAAYFPQVGSPVVLSARGFTLSDQGNGKWRLSTTGGIIPVELAVATGSAIVTEAGAGVDEVVFGVMGMSTMDYLLNPGGPYGKIADPAGIPAVPNVTAWTQSGTGGIVTTEVTAAAVAANDVNPTIANWSVFWHRMAPGVHFHVVDLAVPGTNRPALMDNDSSDDRWPGFTAMLAAVRAAGLEFDAIIDNWGGGGDAVTMKNFGPEWAPFYFGQRWGGQAFTLGNVNPDAVRYPSNKVDNCLWDITAPANAKGRGVFTRERTKLWFSGWNSMAGIPIASQGDQPLLNFSTAADGSPADGDMTALDKPARDVLTAFLADSRVATFAGLNFGSAHVALMDHGASLTGGNHPDVNDPDGQILLSNGIALTALRLAGINVFEPEMTGVTIPAGGAYADIAVSLPNGGSLTTIRALESRGGPSVQPPHYQPVMGFEIRRAGDDDDERRPVSKTTETSVPAAYRGTVAIQDAGSGAPRRAIIRITPTVPFADGDIIEFDRGDASAQLIKPRDSDAKLYLDQPIESVPAWRDVSATYPFVGVPVRPQPPTATLTIGAVAGSGDPPVNTVAPVVSGTTQVGQTLSVTDGTWTGDTPITYSYQWRRNGAPISGATAATYTQVTADIGATIRCTVYADNGIGAPVAQNSNLVGPVTSGAATGIALAQSGIAISDSSFDASYTSGPITIGSAGGRMLVVMVHGYGETTNAAPSDLTVSFGGTPMTASLAATPTPSSRGFIAIHTLANPPTGSATLTVGWTGARRACAVTFAEVVGVASVVATGAVNSAGASVTNLGFTRASGDMMLSGLVLASGALGAQITSDGALLRSGETGTLGTNDTSFGLSQALEGHAFGWTTPDRAALGWIELESN